MATTRARRDEHVLRWIVGMLVVLFVVAVSGGSAKADAEGVQFTSDAATLGTDGTIRVAVTSGSPDQQTVFLQWTAEDIQTVDNSNNAVEPVHLIQPGEVWTVTLQKTSTDRSGFEVTATSTDGTSARLVVTPASLGSWWGSWFDDALVPLATALGEAVLLLAIGSFLASSIADILTRYRSSYGRPHLRPRGMNVVGYVLILFGGARLLFNAGTWPAQGGTLEHWLTTGHRGMTWSIVVVAAVLLTATITRRLLPAGSTVYGRRQRASATWALVDATVVAAAAALVVWPKAGSIRTSLIGAGLLLLGIALLTWHAAWNPELTVESSSTDDTAGAVARLPEALERLSGQGEVRVRMAASVPTAGAVADSLSAVPTNPWTKALVGVVKAITPNTGFRLSVRSEKVDDLVTVRAVIRRGHREVATVTIRCTELHPSAGGDIPPGHDGVAEVAMGLASWLTHRWVELSGDERPASFYGTTDWLAHALVHVAEQHQDAGRFHEADLLLTRAVAADPSSRQAHFCRMSMKVAVVAWPHAHAAVAGPAAEPTMVTARADLRRDLDALLVLLQREYPASALHQQALYLSMAVHHYATDEPGHEGAAQHAANNLARIFELFDAFDRRYLWLFDRRALLAAAGARLSEACVEATREALDVEVRYPYGTERSIGAAMVARLRPLHDVITAPHEHVTLDDDARRQYNRACALADDPTTNRAAIERNLRAAMVVPRLARWALRDPSLRHLWTPALTSEQVPAVAAPATEHVGWFDIYLDRLEELDREAIDLPTDFVAAGMDPALAARVRYQTDITTLRELAAQTAPGHEAELRRRVGAKAATDLMAKHDVWVMAADKAIGPAWARMLDRAGCGRTAELAEAHPETVRARVTAAVAADTKTKLTPPSKQLAEGWVHACIARHRPTTASVDVHRASYVEWERCTVVQQ